MVLENETAIRQVADAGTFYASVQAQNLINMVFGQEYEPIVVLPSQGHGGGGPRGLLVAPSGINCENSLATESVLQAIPNPTKDQTVFHFRLPEEQQKAKLVITSLDGRMIETLDIEFHTGEIAWSTKDVKNGIYLFSLMIEGKVHQSERLVISK